MIATLIALMALVYAVAILNLLLTIGVIRRLREHSVQLSASAMPKAPGAERELLFVDLAGKHSGHDCF